MEGPRAVRPEEFASLSELADTVFHPGMFAEYPQLFNADNAENLRVCVDDDDGGRVVSHVGMIQRPATLFGCSTRVGGIGAVGTLAAYRGSGLAGACFDDAARKSRNDGVDLLLVSGDRSLYRRRGCLRVGDDRVFTQTSVWNVGGPSPAVMLEPLTDADLPQARRLYQQEPVRLLRPPSDWDLARQSQTVMCQLADFWAVRTANNLRAYLIVARPRDTSRSRGGSEQQRRRVARLVEFAGDRHALFAVLPRLFAVYEPPAELGWQVQSHDHLFRSLCEEAGLVGVPSVGPGTIKLLHFPRLMRRLGPRWEELLGEKDAARLSFWQRGGQYGFRFADSGLVTDRDTATRIVFGLPQGSAEAQASAATLATCCDGVLRDVLDTLFPLPVPWYGINYV